MDSPVSPMGRWPAGLDKEKIIRLILAAFILYGFVYCLVAAINFDLNSDYAMPGLASMEIARHGNYMMSGYYLYSDDPFTFTDVIMLHLVPQVLSGYSPTVLKLMSFLNFALVILVFSYIVYRVSGSVTNSMVFSALALNLGPSALKFFLAPVAHTTALFYAGLLLVLFYYLGTKNRPLMIISIVLANLVAFSDTIIFFWFIIPFILGYWLLYKPKNSTNNRWAAALLITSLATLAFKTLAIDYYVKLMAGMNNVHDIFAVNLPNYVVQLSYLMSPGLASVTGGLRQASIIDYLAGLAFVILLILAVKQAFDGRKDKSNVQLTFLYFILIMSGLIIFILYVATTMGNTGPYRYLLYTALGALMLISVSFTSRGWLYPALLLVVLLSCVGYGLLGSGQWSHVPNAREYGLIGYMEKNNLTYGYSDYWTSNLVTYLSDEGVTLRPVTTNGSTITPYTMETSVRWYDDPPQQYVIVVDENGSQAGAMSAYVNSKAPTKKLQYGDYDIYVYDNGSSFDGWQFEKINGYQQLQGFVSTHVLSRLGLNAH